MNALRRILSIAGLPAVPRRLIRPWHLLGLVKGRRGGRRYYRGGCLLLAAGAVLPVVWFFKLFVLVYGYALWAVWAYAVLMVWFLIVAWWYIGRVIFRTADYLIHLHR